MILTKELGNMGKAVEEIGASKSCINETVINETKGIVKNKGLDAAELYAAQLTGTDQDMELLRVLKICRKYNLTPDAIVQVLNKINVIESGKW